MRGSAPAQPAPESDTMTSGPILLTEEQLAERWQMSRSRLEARRLQGEVRAIGDLYGFLPTCGKVA